MQNTGTLITAAIRPNDDADLIASAYSSEIRGGHHSCSTLADRDRIISVRREWGMLATVCQDGSRNGTYQLTYGYADTNIDNNGNWKLFNGSTSSLKEEYPPIIHGQRIITPANRPVSILAVELNGLALKKDDDYTLDDDWSVVLPFDLYHTEQHTDSIKLTHD